MDLYIVWRLMADLFETLLPKFPVRAFVPLLGYLSSAHPTSLRNRRMKISARERARRARERPLCQSYR